MIDCSDMATAVLTGFMGTGKSSVGARLAARLGRPFVDTDEMIERREGCSIAELFARKGESYFRAAERRAVAEASAHEDAVIATGGGAIVDAENLERLRASAPVICLTATPDVILERTREGGAIRPLLRGDDPKRRIGQLLAERSAAYAKVDLTVDTSDRTVDEIVEQIARYLASWREGTRA